MPCYLQCSESQSRRCCILPGSPDGSRCGWAAERDLPAAEYGSWSTVHDRFRSWAVNGVLRAHARSSWRRPAARAVPERIGIRLPIGRPRTRPGAVAADKAYSSRGNRAHLRKRGIEAVIPEKADRAAHHRKRGSRGGRPVRHDPDLYKERNAVERCVNRVKEWRGPAFRFDKTPGSYPAGLHLRGAVLWVRSLRPA
ncbi:hypothetical protein GCM10018953_45450 [Streptosporangium nondiastaticum]